MIRIQFYCNERNKKLNPNVGEKGSGGPEFRDFS